MKRILYILHCYFNRAGTEVHTKHLMHGLAQHYEMRALAPAEDSLQLIAPDGTVEKSYPFSKLAWPVTPYRDELCQNSLAQALDDFKPDIIHVQHFYNWPLSLFDQLLEYGKELVTTFHDYYVLTPYWTLEGVKDPLETLTREYSVRMFKGDASRYLEKRREIWKPAFEKIKYLITPSAYLARVLYQAFPLTYKVIEHGIPPFAPIPNQPQPGVLRFGYVGSVLPQKGWVSLAQAFHQLSAQLPNIELHFYGGIQQLPGFVNNRIFFHGAYEAEQLPEIYSKIDVGIIPSVFPETFSLVLSEMWLGGLPVAVSDIGTLGERVIDGVNGKKFRPGDINSIVQALAWFTQSDEWRSWKAPVPRLIDSMIEDYRSFYGSLANN